MRDLHIIEDGAVLMRDGVITQVGPTRRLERLTEARTAEVIDASGRVVMPAFVDCFTQLLAGPPKWDTLAASVKAFGKWSPQRLEIEGRQRLRQFVRYGTTVVAASSGYGAGEEIELRALRALDRLAESALVELIPYLYTRSAVLQAQQREIGSEMLERMATATLPAARGKRLVRGVAVDDGFPREALAGYLACAGRLGLTSFIESAGGAEGEAVEVACSAKAAAVVGLESVRESETRALSAAADSTAAVLLPGRAFQAGRPGAGGGRPPVARMLIDAGAAVVLATGFDPLSSATASMPMILALACTQLGMSTEEALVAATANPAQALGAGRQSGSLQPGMRADLLITDCSDYREIPLYFGMNPVAAVVRGGAQILPR